MEELNELETLLQDYLDLIEFSLYKEVKEDGSTVYKLIDRQRANLGDIESDEFTTPAELLDRLDVYHNDYIVEDLCDCLDELGIDFDEEYAKTDKEYFDKYGKYPTEYESLYMIANNHKPVDTDFALDVLKMIINPPSPDELDLGKLCTSL